MSSVNDTSMALAVSRLRQRFTGRVHCVDGGGAVSGEPSSVLVDFESICVIVRDSFV